MTRVGRVKRVSKGSSKWSSKRLHSGDPMAINLKLIDKLLADYKKPEDIIGDNGLLKQRTKALLERAMQAEMTDHLGYEKHDPAGKNSAHSSNGATTKTLKGDFGKGPPETPRDRNGSYEPKIIGNGQTRFTRLRR